MVIYNYIERVGDRQMRRAIIPAYKYDEESKTIVDRYICSKCKN